MTKLKDCGRALGIIARHHNRHDLWPTMPEISKLTGPSGKRWTPEYTLDILGFLLESGAIEIFKYKNGFNRGKRYKLTDSALNLSLVAQPSPPAPPATLHETIVIDPTKSYVYFIEALGYDFIKIGFSSSPQDRLNQLSTGHFAKLRLIAIIEGLEQLEKHIHHCFAHLRHHREWFHYTDELKEYIEQLRGDHL